ncbi:MAG: FG-GAP repeat protein [Phycisphaerales bacterium]|nr:FG-GAP repeat protein [Phycisphaerales bacterium]
MSSTRSWIRLEAALFAVALSSLANAQCTPEKLTTSDGTSGDTFGEAVSLSGDTVVVGAYLGGDGNRGSAYVFEKFDGVWTEAATLHASDGEQEDWFGRSVSVEGSTLLVGAPSNASKGSVYFFERIGAEWTQVAKLNAATWSVGFGYSISLDGDRLVVGAPFTDNGSGAAYLFERLGGVWSEIAKITPSDGAAQEEFGISVALSGDSVVVGARWDDDLGTKSGSAYVFERVGGAWTQVVKLTASDGDASDQFGESVSLDGDTVVVGAQYDDGAHGNDYGAAYMFERVGGVWTQVAKLTAADGAGGDHFGDAVSIKGDTVVVGASNDDDIAEDSGSAYVFERVDGVWTQMGKLTAPDARTYGKFGRSIDLSGDTILVGASRSAYVVGLACDCAVNFNGDDAIDTRDLIAFLNAWNGGDSRADWDQNGTIDTRDVLAFLNDWVAGC